MFRSGQHFVQIPGPTNIPERVLRAMDRQIVDHRGPDFAECTLEILPAMQKLVIPKTRTSCSILRPERARGKPPLLTYFRPVIACSSPRPDSSRICGPISTRRLGLDVELIPGDWRHGADPDEIGAPP